MFAPEATSFIPLFGSVVPQPMSPARDASGSLDRGQDAYYTTRLTPGKYRVTADFTRVPRVPGTILGAVTLLDADGGGAILQTLTLRNLGVPYLVGGEFSSGGLRVNAPQGVTGVTVLTIEPGVTLLFRENGIVEIEHFTGDFPALGALVAQGTPDEPIVFTSFAETPAAGDWYGLRYGLLPSDLNALEYVRIEYAGAGSPASGADRKSVV